MKSSSWFEMIAELIVCLTIELDVDRDASTAKVPFYNSCSFSLACGTFVPKYLFF